MVSYARAILSADKSFTGGTTLTCSWDSAAADTDSYWSGASPTRMTVPAGINYIRLFGSIEWESLSAQQGLQVYFEKNGSTFDPDFVWNLRRESGGYANNPQFLASPLIAVSEGDYFELLGIASNSSIDNFLDVRSFFEIVGYSSVAATVVKLNSTFTASPDFTTSTEVEWDAEMIDTDDAWSSSPNPADIVVPAGYTYAKALLGLQFEENTAVRHISGRVLSEGVEVGQGSLTGQEPTGSAINSLLVPTPTFSVSEGDVITAEAYCIWSTIDELLDGSFFQVEFYNAS